MSRSMKREELDDQMRERDRRAALHCIVGQCPVGYAELSNLS